MANNRHISFTTINENATTNRRREAEICRALADFVGEFPRRSTGSVSALNDVLRTELAFPASVTHINCENSGVVTRVVVAYDTHGTNPPRTNTIGEEVSERFAAEIQNRQFHSECVRIQELLFIRYPQFRRYIDTSLNFRMAFEHAVVYYVNVQGTENYLRGADYDWMNQKIIELLVLNPQREASATNKSKITDKPERNLDA